LRVGFYPKGKFMKKCVDSYRHYVIKRLQSPLLMHDNREISDPLSRDQMNAVTKPSSAHEHIKPMATNKPQTRVRKGLIFGLALAFVTGISPAWAQTLKLRFPFDDAGPGTTTASDTGGGGLAVTLSMETSTAGTGVDLHGAAGSGIQGAGRSLNQS